VDVVKALVAAGANVDAAMPNDATSLFIACQNGHVNVVNALIAAGANIFARMIFGSTPLSIAYDNENYDIVCLLSRVAVPCGSSALSRSTRSVALTRCLLSLQEHHDLDTFAVRGVPASAWF
jgi:hypothetical protein